MGFINDIVNFLRNWKFLVLIMAIFGLMIFTPIIPDKFHGDGCKESPFTARKSGVLYTALVMMVLFVIRYPHMGVVSFLPGAFLPLFALTKTDQVCSFYMLNTNMTFFATAMVGIALGCTQLQKRFVYSLLAISGVNLVILVVIVMWTTAILSAFLTSSTAVFIMIPVAVLIKDEIIKCLLDEETEDAEAVAPQKVFFKRRFTTAPKFGNKEDYETVEKVPGTVPEYEGLEQPSQNSVATPTSLATPDTSNFNSAQDVPNKETGDLNEEENTDENSAEKEKTPEEMDDMNAQLAVVAPKIPEIENIDKLHPDDKIALLKFEESLLLTIAAAANIGGIFFPYSTIVSDFLYYMTTKVYRSNSNIVEVEKVQYKQYTPTPITQYVPIAQSAPLVLTTRDWVVYNFPTFIIVMLVVSYLQVYLNFAIQSNSLFACKCKTNSVDAADTGVIKSNDPELNKKVKELMKKRYHELGFLRFREGVLLVMFTFYSFLFFFREPRYQTGWLEEMRHELNRPVFIGDSCIAIVFLTIFFFIPRRIREMVLPPTDDKHFIVEPLMPFKSILSRVPWGVILMVGASCAIVKVAEATYFNDHLARYLLILDVLPKEIMLLVVIIITSVCSQLFGNVMVIGISVPVLLKVSVSLKIHPWYFTLPVTTSCILSFMFPVSTVCNAILFHENKVSFTRMIKQGCITNLITATIVYVLHITYARFIFDLASEFDYPGLVYPAGGSCQIQIKTT